MSTGLSPTSTAPPAPRAHLPAHEATHAARRPASQRPSLSRTTQRAAIDDGRVAVHEPQRPAGGLQLDRQRAVVADAVAGEPPGEAVVARRAALGERGDRCVGGGGRLGRRLVGLLGPAGGDPVGRPGSARERPGTVCITSSGSRRPVEDDALSCAQGTVRTMAGRTRSSWGWGFEDAAFTAEQALEAAPGLPALLGIEAAAIEEPVALEAAVLPPPRVAPPGGALAAICSQEHRERATHAYGKSYLDTVRAFRGVYEHVPDLVARPRDESRGRGAARVGGRRERGGHPVRRRDERRRRRRAADPGAAERRAVARPRRARLPARAGRGLARRADRRGRRRARASRSCSARTA